MVDYAVDIAHYDIEFVSVSVKQALVIYAWIVEVTNAAIYLVLIQVVLKHSTKAIGAYKWYLIACQTSCLLVFILKSSFEDEPLFPYAVTIVGGLVHFLPYQKVIVIRTFYSMFHILFCLHFIIFTLMFMFRYAQTTGRQRMVQFMSSITTLYFVYLPFLICLIVAANLDALNSIPDPALFLEKFGNTDLKLTEYIKGKPIMVELTTSYNNYIRVIPSLIGFSICAYCTYGCFSYQHEQNGSLSERTRKLYRTLIKALLIEFGIVLFIVFIPVLSCQEFIEPKHRPLGAALIWRWLYLYPTFSMIFAMSYIGCYRKGVQKMILKLLNATHTDIVVYQTKASIQSSNL